MCLSNDCYIKVIHNLMTVLLEYIDLNEHSLLKMFVRFKFNESNSNIRNIRFSLTDNYIHIKLTGTISFIKVKIICYDIYWHACIPYMHMGKTQAGLTVCIKLPLSFTEVIANIICICIISYVICIFANVYIFFAYSNEASVEQLPYYMWHRDTFIEQLNEIEALNDINN